MIDLHQRKREATDRRIAEILALPGIINSQQLRDILDRQYEAGVHDHSDFVEEGRLMAMEKYRKQPLPAAIMEVEPGKIIQMVRDGN